MCLWNALIYCEVRMKISSQRKESFYENSSTYCCWRTSNKCQWLKLTDFATFNSMKIMNFFYKKYSNTHGHFAIINNYRQFHCKQEAIRSIPRCESLQREWYWFRSLFDFGWIKISTKVVRFTQEHYTQRKYTSL